MFKSENTTYVIRYDYSLNGGAISLPKNSTLEFDGGSIIDGKIEGRNTRIINSTSNSFINIETTGTWNTELSEPIEGEIKTVNVVRDIIANQDSITNIENNIDNIEEDIKDIDTDLSGLHEDFNNLPKVDEEDITVGEDNFIKFKDKEYSEKDYSGLGRVYLRKNIVANRNILTQEMLNKPNTIYIIQYDYDLNQKEITIPENCILNFEGGSITNGILKLNETNIKSPAIQIFENVKLKGSVVESTFLVEWFGVKQNESYQDKNIKIAIENVSNLGGGILLFQAGGYLFSSTIWLKHNVGLRGTNNPSYYGGTKKKYTNLKFNNLDDGNWWCIDTDAYNKDTGERFPHNYLHTKLSGNTKEQISAFYIEDLIITGITGSKIFGGIRLYKCVNSTVKNVSIYYVKVGLYLSSSWGSIFDKIIIKSYIHGVILGAEITTENIRTIFCQRVKYDNEYLKVTENEYFDQGHKIYLYRPDIQEEDSSLFSYGLISSGSNITLTNPAFESYDVAITSYNSNIITIQPYYEYLTKFIIYIRNGNFYEINPVGNQSTEYTKYEEYSTGWGGSMKLENSYAFRTKIINDSNLSSTISIYLPQRSKVGSNVEFIFNNSEQVIYNNCVTSDTIYVTNDINCTTNLGIHKNNPIPLKEALLRINNNKNYINIHNILLVDSIVNNVKLSEIIKYKKLTIEPLEGRKELSLNARFRSCNLTFKNLDFTKEYNTINNGIITIINSGEIYLYNIKAEVSLFTVEDDSMSSILINENNRAESNPSPNIVFFSKFQGNRSYNLKDYTHYVDGKLLSAKTVSTIEDLELFPKSPLGSITYIKDIKALAVKEMSSSGSYIWNLYYPNLHKEIENLQKQIDELKNPTE